MKIKKDFWRDGKALWIQIIAFAVAVMLYIVCCYPIYTCLLYTSDAADE